MKRWMLTTLALSFCSFSALSAALPPLYQSKKEIETIMMSPEFASKLGSGAQIQEISKVTNGYLFVTNQSVLFVEVRYIQTDRIGPFRFKLYFHDLMPLDSHSTY